MSKRIHKGELKPRRHHWHSLELVGCRVGFLCFNNICSLEFKFQAAQNGHKFSSKVIVMYTMLSSSKFQIEVKYFLKWKIQRQCKITFNWGTERIVSSQLTQVDADSIDALLFWDTSETALPKRRRVNERKLLQNLNGRAQFCTFLRAQANNNYSNVSFGF